MKILVAIDGAGGAFETTTEYSARYWDSWVRRIYARRADRSIYCHAPRIVTESLNNRANEIVSWLRGHTSPGDEIYFTGYSRGAATCLLAANRLSNLFLDGRTIPAIGLFDAVANDSGADLECRFMRLPETDVYHARRMRDIGNPLFPRLEIGCNRLVQNDFDGDHTDLGGASSAFSIRAFEWIAQNLSSAGVIR